MLPYIQIVLYVRLFRYLLFLNKPFIVLQRKIDQKDKKPLKSTLCRLLVSTKTGQGLVIDIVFDGTVFRNIFADFTSTS